GDLNGDGKLDLAVTNYGSFWAFGSMPDNTVTILLGNGDGTFTAAAGSPVSVGTDPTAVVVADFNGDGKLDLAVVNGSDQTVSILLGRGDGTFTVVSAAPAANAFALATGDFNQDGNLDLAVSNSGTAAITILLGNGDGTFTAAAS